jgi:Ulp1 family protease
MNGYECGIFVCMYADYIANGWPLVFYQLHINCCRELAAVQNRFYGLKL